MLYEAISQVAARIAAALLAIFMLAWLLLLVAGFVAILFGYNPMRWVRRGYWFRYYS